MYEIRGDLTVRLATGHHAHDSGAVLGAVQASALRSDPASAGPSGLDGACAQLAEWLLPDGRPRRWCNGHVAGLDAGFDAAVFCGYLAGATRHPLRIAHSACGARSRSSLSGHDRTLPTNTTFGCPPWCTTHQGLELRAQTQSALNDASSQGPAFLTATFGDS